MVVKRLWIAKRGWKVIIINYKYLSFKEYYNIIKVKVRF